MGVAQAQAWLKSASQQIFAQSFPMKLNFSGNLMRPTKLYLQGNATSVRRIKAKPSL